MFVVRSDLRLRLIAVGVAVVVSFLWANDLVDALRQVNTVPERMTYAQFVEEVSRDRIAQVKIYEVTGRVVGVRKSGTGFETRVPGGRVPAADSQMFDQHDLARSFEPSRPHILSSLLLLWLLPICLAIAFVRGGEKPRGVGSLMGGRVRVGLPQ